MDGDPPRDHLPFLCCVSLIPIVAWGVGVVGKPRAGSQGGFPWEEKEWGNSLLLGATVTLQGTIGAGRSEGTHRGALGEGG